MDLFPQMSQIKRQNVDGQLTSVRHAGEETPALPDMNLAPLAFRMNQSSAMCLPVLSEGTKFVWVRSQQVNLQIDGEAELDRAFDRFPYLTREENAALAKSCSLHPDQVKVWFMAQRLRYGISWECEDICNIRKKLKSSESGAQGEDGLQKGIKGAVKEDDLTTKKQRRDVMEFDWKRVGQEEKGRIMGENVKAGDQLDGEESPPMMKEDKDKRKGKKKRVKQESIEGEEQNKPTLSIGEKKRKKRKRKKEMKSIQELPTSKNFLVLDMPPFGSSSVLLKLEKQTTDTSSLISKVTELQKNLNLSCRSPNNPPTSVIELTERATKTDAGPEKTNLNTVVTDVSEQKEFQDFFGAVGTADAPPVVPESCVAKVSVPPTCNSIKTEAKQAMLRKAFLSCQYPDANHYTRLAVDIDISRYSLVQWFNDMRYYIKRGKPKWMNEEQHRKVVASIRLRQYMTKLAKLGPKLEKIENSREGTSATVPLQ